MKGIAVGILLFALAGTGTVMAQDHGGRSHRVSDWRHADHSRHDHNWNWRRGDYGSHDRYRGCRDGRGIYSDIRNDERQLEYDRWILSQLERQGNERAAERQREEIRDRYRDIQRDREAARRDRANRAWNWMRDAGFGLR